jgi:hypothetical protein
MFFTTTVTGDQTFEHLPEATAIADQRTLDNHIEVKVLGHSDSFEEPMLAYHTSPRVINGVVQGHFAPWTRVEALTNRIVPPYVKDYTFAYQRTRIGVAIYRPDVKGQSWLAVDTTNGEKHFEPNTKAMCKYTTSLAVAAREAKANAKAAAKAAKAAAKEAPVAV